MASYYVYSGAVGAANGTTWADAYTKLETAISGKATGDIFYIAHDHDESTAATVVITGPTLAQFLCVNRAGSVPPVAADLMTGALIQTSASGHFGIDAARSYWYGVAFRIGVGGSSNLQFNHNFAGILERCHFKMATTGSTSTLNPSNCKWVNCTVEFSDVGQIISGDCWRWENTASAIVGATIPNSLIRNAGGANIQVEGVDLSAVPSGKQILQLGNTALLPSYFKDCKLASGVTIAPTLNNWGVGTVDVIRCDSGATNYRHERYHGVGIQTTETTIVRTGGASDGVTPISWKIVTAASATVALPFESMPISVWNDTTGGTKTITVEGIWGGGAVPDNNDIWIEVEYLGSASDPQGSYVSSRAATILTTPSSYASSSETWGGSTTKFKMSATTGTIQHKGPITVRVFAALASSTFYIDPKINFS